MSDRSAGTSGQDREFEMVLDNKKLFSILFITFVLLGVFFAMGYALGRSSAPVEAANRPAVSMPESSSPAAARPTAAGARVEPAPEEKEDREEPETRSTREAAAPVRTQPATEPAPEPGALLQPQPGQTFLQVTAVARPEAEILAEVLARKGFRAGVAAGPNENFWRVLVGPTSSDAELAKLKSDLEQAGFKPFPRRY